MKKIKNLSLNGWDIYQWGYVLKWHTAKYGRSDDLELVKSKWDTDEDNPPPSVNDLFDTDQAIKVFKKWLGDNLTSADQLTIELTKD